jgi:hypothetical protein
LSKSLKSWEGGQTCAQKRIQVQTRRLGICPNLRNADLGWARSWRWPNLRPRSVQPVLSCCPERPLPGSLPKLRRPNLRRPKASPSPNLRTKLSETCSAFEALPVGAPTCGPPSSSAPSLKPPTFAPKPSPCRSEHPTCAGVGPSLFAAMAPTNSTHLTGSTTRSTSDLHWHTCEGICQGCFHSSRMKVMGSKTIRYPTCARAAQSFASELRPNLRRRRLPQRSWRWPERLCWLPNLRRPNLRPPPPKPSPSPNLRTARPQALRDSTSRLPSWCPNLRPRCPNLRPPQTCATRGPESAPSGATGGRRSPHPVPEKLCLGCPSRNFG